MNFQFSLSQTPAARKIFRIPASLKSEIKRAARIVAANELAGISEFGLSVVCMSDSELLELNQSALGHDWYTDIITFELERSTTAIETEVYISVERARANAQRFHQASELELLHLVIHGVLHIAGYNDKSSSAKKQMRKRERLYLVQFRLR